MVKTQHFHCQGSRFEPWLGNYDPASHVSQPKNKLPKKKKKKNPEIMRLFARLHKVSRKVTTITMSKKKSTNLWIYRKKVGGTGVMMF